MKTGNVDKLLSNQNIYYLCHIGDNAPNELTVQTWFEKEGIIAVSYIRPEKDEYGRSGVWNHTILVPIRDYLELTQPAVLLSPYLMKGSAEPPQKLEQIEVQVKR